MNFQKLAHKAFQGIIPKRAEPHLSLTNGKCQRTYPVASFDEYRNRVSADHSKWKIVPVDTCLFPENLKEPLPAESRATDPGAILLVVFALVEIFGLSFETGSGVENYS
jgi:hypothetical protein